MNSTAIALFVRGPLTEEDIERFVDELPKEAVVPFLLGAMQVKQQATQAIKMAESRIVGEQVLTTGELHTDESGTEWMWTGERRREVADPAGLKAALTAIASEWGTLAKRALAAAFKPQPDKVYLTELDKITKFSPDAEDIVRDFAEWKSGPPHLRPVAEEPR